MYQEKSQLRRTAETVILIGAILDTLIWSVVILCSLGLGAIIGLPLIILVWTARKNSLAGSYGWTIYGIIHGICSGWITLAGYIMLLIDNSKQSQPQSYQQSYQQPQHPSDTYRPEGL